MKTMLGLLCALMLVAGCAGSDYTKMYSTSAVAPSFTEADVAALNHLGSKLTDRGTSFNLYSANATRVELLLFDDPESSDPVQIFAMTKIGNVWSIYVEGVAEGAYYGFRCWGPNWTYEPYWYPGSMAGFIADVDAAGNRFNPNKVLMDPYGRAFHRDHDWSKGSAGSGAARAESTVAASAKSIVVRPGAYGWSGDEQTYWANRQNGTALEMNKLVFYEVHLKGFTMDYKGRISWAGTYRGLGEKAAYLAELGINAVELLPVHEAGADGGYWKYWTLGFFAPESEYSSDPREGNQINEFKWMVEQLHKYNIALILDVVYNHSGEGGLWRQKVPTGQYNNPGDIWETGNSWAYDPADTATILCFRGIDNQEYYSLVPGAKASYWETTGCGNMIRCNNTPGRRMVLDSLRYWVEEMHVDGFRFDLASVLGREDANPGTFNNTSTLINDIVNDPVFQTNKTILVAEAWDTGNPGYFVGGFPKATTGDTSFAWMEWNGAMRDAVRYLVNISSATLNTKQNDIDFGGAMTGSGDKFSWNGRGPNHSVNMITVHDGFTLYDLLSYSSKRNGTGPLNPEGADPNSGSDDNKSKDWAAYQDPSLPRISYQDEEKRQVYRTITSVLFLAHGTPLMLGGDEWMRTQLGNNNAYTTGSDNFYNWFRWYFWQQSDTLDGGSAARWRMFDFYKKLIQFRKDHAYAFCPTTYTIAGTKAEFSWKKNDNTAADGGTWGGRVIAQHYYNTSPDKQIFVAWNFSTGDVNFTLPAGITWEVRIDAQAFFDGNAMTSTTSGNIGTAGNPVNGTLVTGGNTYGVKANSVCVFVQQ